VNWTNEEGARFRPSLLGSGVYAGALDREFALALADGQGITVAQALGAIGYLGDDAAPAFPAFYAELHVEQGRTLERAGRRIGVVARSWAAFKYEITFLGEQAHTGPTPMDDRRDALYGAARVITHVRELTAGTGGRLHSSVGRVEIHPNSSNVVPSEVTIAVELRALEEEILLAADGALREAVAAAERAAGVTATYRATVRREAKPFDAAARRLAARAAETAGFQPMDIDTVAGHDAISLRAVAPAALIFVPSIGGISHNEAELTGRDDLEAGVQVLAQLLTDLCRDGIADASAPVLQDGASA
jgi:N-carbamoyl-L-amino-acid hydrolase